MKYSFIIRILVGMPPMPTNEHMNIANRWRRLKKEA